MPKREFLGQITQVRPDIDGSLTFDGVNDFVDIPNLTSLSGNLDFRFQCWAKLSSSATAKNVLFGRGTAFVVGAVYFMIEKDNPAGIDTLKFGIAGGQEWRKGYPSGFFDDKWFHFACAYRASTSELYVFLNSVLLVSDVVPSPPSSSGLPAEASIGNWLKDRYSFEGEIAEASIWSDFGLGTFGESLIRGSWTKKLSGNEANLVRYYRLDDLNGSTAEDDKASQNATLINFGSNPSWSNEKPPIVKRVKSGLLDDISISQYSDVLFAGSGDLSLEIPSKWDGQVTQNGIQIMDEIEFFVIDRKRNRKKRIYSGTIVSIERRASSTESIKIKCVGELFFLENTVIEDFGGVKLTYGGDSFTGGASRKVLTDLWAYYYRLQPLSDLTVNVEVSTDSYAFTKSFATFADVLDEAQSLAEPDYYWKITPENVLIGRKISTTPDKYFYFGRDIIELNYNENAEDVVNNVYVSNNKNNGDSALISNVYTDQNSINKYRRRSLVVNDSQLSSDFQASNIANGELKKSDKATSITLRLVSDAYSKFGTDIDDLEAGQTFKILNIKPESGLTGLYVIQSVKVNQEYAEIKAEDRRVLTARRLLELEKKLKKRTDNANGAVSVTSKAF